MARTPLVPKEIFFTKGVGRHQNRLQARLAPRHAGIEKGNLVRVSSIFPPTARIITKAKGLRALPGRRDHLRGAGRDLDG